MPVIKGEGYKPGEDSGDTGRIAKPRDAPEGWAQGKPSPQVPHEPFARWVTLHTILGEGSAADDTSGALSNLESAFETWKQAAAAENYRITDVRFEWVTEGKVVMYIMYSE